MCIMDKNSSENLLPQKNYISCISVSQVNPTLSGICQFLLKFLIKRLEYQVRGHQVTENIKEKPSL